LPNQRFYYDWYDEIEASPLTEKEYRNLANEILQTLHSLGYVKMDKLQAQHKQEIAGMIEELLELAYAQDGRIPIEKLNNFKAKYLKE